MYITNKFKKDLIYLSIFGAILGLTTAILTFIVPKPENLNLIVSAFTKDIVMSLLFTLLIVLTGVVLVCCFLYPAKFYLKSLNSKNKNLSDANMEVTPIIHIWLASVMLISVAFLLRITIYFWIPIVIAIIIAIIVAVLLKFKKKKKH